MAELQTQSGHALVIGDRVYLRGLRVGEPGRVIRLERGKVVILWKDLDYIGRHSANSLTAASESPASRAKRIEDKTQCSQSSYASPAFSERENPVPPPKPNRPAASTPNPRPYQETLPW